MRANAFFFGAVNAWLYLRHPYLIARCAKKNGLWPNIACPQVYCERMLWRKLLDRSPQFVTFSDKLATKEFISHRCPDLPQPKTLWVGEDAAQIPPALLRIEVFVKANHGCGYNYRIRNGELNQDDLLQQTRRWMKSRYGRHQRQWGYSAVKRKLYVEEAIGDAATDLIEFNIRASNGHVILGSIMGRVKLPDQWFAYLDLVGRPTLGWHDPEGSEPKLSAAAQLVMPQYLRAVEFSRRLSVGIDYGRFDFMWNGRELYGGEVTMYPAGGVLNPANRTVHAATLAGWDLVQAEFFKIPQRGWRAAYARQLLRHLESARTVPHCFAP